MLTQTRLKSLLRLHNREFFWVHSRGRAAAGSRAGFTGLGNQRRIVVDGRPYLESALESLYLTGSGSSIAPNRKARDRQSLDKSSHRTGISGVTYLVHKQSYAVRLQYRNHLETLGSYPDLETATLVRRTAEALAHQGQPFNKKAVLELTGLKTKTKGVSLNSKTGKWEASLSIKGVRYFIGRFSSYDVAHNARVKAGKLEPGSPHLEKYRVTPRPGRFCQSPDDHPNRKNCSYLEEDHCTKYGNFTTPHERVLYSTPLYLLL